MTAVPESTLIETAQDLYDALANLTRAHDAALAQNRELQSRLTAAQETIYQFTSRQPHRIWADDTIFMLSDARKHLRSGNVAECTYHLEKALDRADASWRTR